MQRLSDLAVVQSAAGTETIDFLESKQHKLLRIRLPMKQRYEAPFPSQRVYQILWRPSVYFSAAIFKPVYELFNKVGFKLAQKASGADVVFTHHKAHRDDHAGAFYVNQLPSQHVLTNNGALQQALARTGADVLMRTAAGASAGDGPFFDMEGRRVTSEASGSGVLWRIQKQNYLHDGRRLGASFYCLVIQGGATRCYVYEKQAVATAAEPFDPENVTPGNYYIDYGAAQFRPLGGELVEAARRSIGEAVHAYELRAAGVARSHQTAFQFLRVDATFFDERLNHKCLINSVRAVYDFAQDELRLLLARGMQVVGFGEIPLRCASTEDIAAAKRRAGGGGVARSLYAQELGGLLDTPGARVSPAALSDFDLHQAAVYAEERRRAAAAGFALAHPLRETVRSGRAGYHESLAVLLSGADAAALLGADRERQAARVARQLVEEMVARVCDRIE